MSAYAAPLKDMRFVLKRAGRACRGCEAAGVRGSLADTVNAILEEASKFGF